MGHQPPTKLPRRLMSTPQSLGVERNLFMRSVQTPKISETCDFRFDYPFLSACFVSPSSPCPICFVIHISFFDFSLTFAFNRFSVLILYIFIQLFENQSVVEYWENFASHAFESTTQSVVSHCVLLKPNGAPVPCTFCFSIRRDIMDLPSLIIGEYFFLVR